MLSRLIVTFTMLTCLLSGCAGVVAVGGAVSDYVVDNFKGIENSMPVKVDTAMAAVQQGLKKTDFTADVIEFVDGGYLVEFKNGQLEGIIHLSSQTKKLTTLYIKVKSSGGVVREEAIERTVLEVIAKQAKRVSKRALFNFAGYNYIRSKPTLSSEKLGRYRRAANLELSPSPQKGWLMIKMPSGKQAFLKAKRPGKRS